MPTTLARAWSPLVPVIVLPMMSRSVLPKASTPAGISIRGPGIADAGDGVAGDRAGRVGRLEAVLGVDRLGAAAGDGHAGDVEVGAVEDGRVLLEIADRAARHGEGEQAVIVDLDADAALDAADRRFAAGVGAARIGIAHADDVDAEQRARGVAVEDAVEIGLAGAAALVDRVAAAVAVDVDIVEDDVGLFVDGEHALDLAVAGGAAVSTRSAGAWMVTCAPSAARMVRLSMIVDDDLLDIGAGRDEDRVAVAGRVDRGLDGREAARPTSRMLTGRRPSTISMPVSVSVPSVDGHRPAGAVCRSPSRQRIGDAATAVDISPASVIVVGDQQRRYRPAVCRRRGVVAGAAAERVVAVAAEQHVVAAARRSARRCRPRCGLRRAVVAVDIVGAGGAGERVVARAAEDDDDVVAGRRPASACRPRRRRRR